MSDLAPPPPASNVPEYTVSEIAGAVKRTLDGAAARVRPGVRRWGAAVDLCRGGSAGARLRLRFADGEVGAVADGGGKEKRQGLLSL
jgi:hypothetical protein